MLKRLEYIERVVSATDCGTDFVLNQKTELLPLYRSAGDEARAIATSKQERLRILAVLRWRYLAEYGPEEMRRRVQSESAEIRMERE